MEMMKSERKGIKGDWQVWRREEVNGAILPLGGWLFDFSEEMRSICCERLDYQQYIEKSMETDQLYG